MINFDMWKTIDMRVGKVVDVEEIKDARNLIRLQVDFGAEHRQAVAGIAKWYRAEELKGKKFVFVLNLEPKKIFGYESNCMILAAQDEKGNVVLIAPEKDVKEGSRIV